MIVVIKSYPTEKPYILYSDNRLYIEEFTTIPEITKHIINYTNCIPQDIIRFEFKDRTILFAQIANINN